jgi:type IV secretory pathway VirB9-like protein
MKPRSQLSSNVWFCYGSRIRLLLVCGLDSALPLRAAGDGARVVKYSKQDIVPVRAKLRFSTLIVLPDDEEILDFTTGDKEFWIINGAHNLCYVHPAQAGIRSNLNLITASGHVYSFLADRNQQRTQRRSRSQDFHRAGREIGGLRFDIRPARLCERGEAEAYKKELDTIRSQTAEQIHAAEARVAEEENHFRAGYARKFSSTTSSSQKLRVNPSS